MLSYGRNDDKNKFYDYCSGNINLSNVEFVFKNIWELQCLSYEITLLSNTSYPYLYFKLGDTNQKITFFLEQRNFNEQALNLSADEWGE